MSSATPSASVRLSHAYAELLSNRYRHQPGRSPYLDWESSVLQALDRLFNATLASRIPENLKMSAEQLRALAAMVRHDRGFTAPALKGSHPTMLLPRAVEVFQQIYWRTSSAGPEAAGHAESNQASPDQDQKHFLDRLVVAPETVKWAGILSLCLGLAFATRWVNDDAHWYWTPLTVIIVLKPDLGSVFARTLLRVIGTLLGVVVGVLIFMALPKGLALVAVVALFAAALPWAAQRSYGLATFCATIIVLVLLDEIAPGAHNIDYGLPRLIDTLVGGAIILVFGYFLWPRTHQIELERSFQAARQKLAIYLVALKPTGRSPESEHVPGARRGAYLALACMRSQLQNAMQEPPPAGPEAAAWFPLVTSTEQLCDDISGWAAKHSISPEQEAIIDQLAAKVSGESPLRTELVAESQQGGDPFSRLTTTILVWLHQLDRMTDRQEDAQEPPTKSTSP